MITVKARRISPDVMEGLGKAVCISADTKPDAQTDIQTFYGQLAIMNCEDAIQIGVCVAKNRKYVVDEMERHANTSELLFAIKGDFVTAVTSSAEVDGKLCPDLDKVMAVRVNQGEGIFFNEGVWHWTPYAITPTCDVLVIFKKDTPKNDFISCRLEKTITMEL
ncbi:MAG: ureidoglycolate lyase [Burkholderiales bacterium]